MLRKPLDSYPQTLIEHCISQIDFFAALAENDAEQLALIMQHTQLIELEAGEVLIEKDTIGNAFYALVRGELAIFPDKQLGDQAICRLLPSQIVGALAMLNRQPRTATVAVASLDGALVMATDFTVFGELDDFSAIHLTTKLCLFRLVVQHIYQTIIAMQAQSPDQRLAEELAILMQSPHQPDSVDELEYLAEFAMGLAWLLASWNLKVQPEVEMFSETALEQKLAALLKKIK